MKRPNGLRKRRGGNWYGNWRDAQGQRHERCLGPDMRVAARLLARLRENALRAEHGLEDELLQEQGVERLIREWRSHLELDAKPKHVRDATAGLRLILETMGAREVRHVTAGRVLAAQTELKTTRSHRTVNKLCGYLLAWLRWLELSNRIARSPISGFKRLPEKGEHRRRRRRRLTLEEAALLQEAADRDPLLGDLVATALGTGFRLGELLALTWADWSGAALTVRPEASKNGDPRTNPVPPELAERLRQRRQRAGVSGGKADDPIFAIHWHTASRRLKRARAAANLPERWPDGTVLDWHALRHTYCTWLREAGVDVGTAAVLMGHRSLRMTQEVYTETGRVPTEAAVAALGALTVAQRWHARETS